MTLKILDAKLTLAVIDGDAHPDVAIKQSGADNRIVCHLTKGFDGNDWVGDALTASAHVPVVAGPGDNPLDWTFSFVQIGRCNFCGAFYAGRIFREGSIGILCHNPPALPNPVLLDGSLVFGVPPDPWFKSPSKSFTPPLMNANTGDHPGSKIPLTLKNSATSNVDNFLWQHILDREFWTIFTAQDPGGTLNYIAHYHWQVRYDFEFTWNSGSAKLRRSNSFCKVLERKVVGPPTDADLKPLLASPRGPRANKVFGEAIIKAFYGARGPNRSENPHWFPRVPQDFWT